MKEKKTNWVSSKYRNVGGGGHNNIRYKYSLIKKNNTKSSTSILVVRGIGNIKDKS